MQEMTILVPTMDAIKQIALWYFIIGMAPWLVHCVSYVWCDYGRMIKKHNLLELMLLGIIDLAMWPLNFGNTKDNFSGFNRDHRYYQ